MPERYIGQSFGKYQVQSLIGSGGFAWVFRGYDPELDIPVAIKVLKPQFAGDPTLVDRFRREASTAAKLRHPNIIKIYAVGREGDAVYFVMDFLPTGLADKLEATNALPEEYVLRVGIDVARALDFAHREGVIHRDIKVDNILFDAHGNAVVADFGIARAVTGYTQHTGTNMVVGTPQYFAPEQARAKPLDGRADIYSLGVTLYRASTGRLPFEGDDWYEIARQHVEEPPPAPRAAMPSLSAEFERVLLRCLEKSPSDRPTTGEQLAEELAQIVAQHKDPTLARTLTVPAHVTVAKPIARIELLPPKPRGRVVRILALTTLALAALGAVAWPYVRDRLGTTTAADSTGTPPTVIPPAESLLAKGPESTAATLATADTVVHLTITASPEVRLIFNGTAVGSGGTWKADSVKPGSYHISGALDAPPGCSTAVDSQIVTLKVGRQRVTLHPRSCGTLSITARAISQRTNKPTGTITYRIESGGAAVRDGTLPLQNPLVLPVGQYRVLLDAPTCATTQTDVSIAANQPVSRERSLVCP